MHPQVVVAGSVCLDVIPTIDKQRKALDLLFQPGKMLAVGTAVTAPGGAVPNTGLALHRLGIPVKLVGKVGNDLFGQELLKQFRQYREELAAGMIISEEEATSYTIVISPPGVDRFFLHCTGANNSFCAGDVNSSIPNWDNVQTRIQSGWTQHTPTISLAGWQQKNKIWIGPDDRKRQ